MKQSDAYNLIRGLMVQVAAEAGLLPWQLSFAGAVQTVVALCTLAWSSEQEQWEAIGLDAIAWSQFLSRSQATVSIWVDTSTASGVSPSAG